MLIYLKALPGVNLFFSIFFLQSALPLASQSSWIIYKRTILFLAFSSTDLSLCLLCWVLPVTRYPLVCHSFIRPNYQSKNIDLMRKISDFPLGRCEMDSNCPKHLLINWLKLFCPGDWRLLGKVLWFINKSNENL